MSRNTRSILYRAAESALYSAKEQEQGGGGGGDNPPEKLEFTQDELEAKLAEARDAAVKEEREKRKAAEKEKRARERKERGEEEEEEDPAAVVAAAEQRAAEAEQRAAASERKSIMADVNVKLRDYLTANFKEFVGNAPDIILHIEKALPAEPTEQAIIRLIEAHSKAFVERTKSARGTITNNSIVNRSKISGLPQNEQREQRPQSREQQPPDRRFAAINWHG